MWFAGYMYKYWINEYTADSRDAYKLCALRNLESRYYFYHTQGFEYVIDSILWHPFQQDEM